jgi:bifunctional non-homologous end joining protein LigD
VAHKSVEVDVEGRRLRLSNLDKVLYPATGFTKGQVIDYYTRAAPYVLPHLRGRALTLKRYPNGVEAGHFYEKQRPSHAPDWVRSKAIEAGDRTIDFVLCDDLPTLVWLANLADLELHPSLALAEDVDRPTVLAFDLDPGPPAAVEHCCRVALLLRETLGQLELECFAKTSGSKGMQVYVPLNSAVDYDRTKPFAHGVARLLERRDGDSITSVMKKSERVGKVFIDWSQNDRHKTTVGVYSLRARERATVSTPLRWEEVERVAEGSDPEALVFDSQQVLERVDRFGDLFAPVLEREQRLPDL